MKSVLRNLLFAVATSASSIAFAADLPSIKSAPEPVSDDWIVTLSGQLSVGPSYPGAKTYTFYGLPGIGLRRASEVEHYSTPDDGFNFALYNNDWFRFGVVGRVVGDRPVHKNCELVGMSYVPPSVELGGFAEVNPLSWARLRVEIRQAVTGHSSVTATAGADIWHSWGQWTFSIGPRAYFGDDGYAQRFFGVTPAQALANNLAGGNLAAYNADGGLTAAGGTVAARYDLNEFWRITGYGNYQRLTGSVAGSPIAIRSGSRDQYMAGVELAYRWRTGSLPLIGALGF